MCTNRPPDPDRHVVCGQADAILDLLERSDGLPVSLCLHIEEALETAWEIAYRRPTGHVIALPLVPHAAASASRRRDRRPTGAKRA